MDPDASVAKAFGVPISNGRVKRMTFVIDGNGVITKAWRQVKVDGHHQEVLAAVREAAAVPTTPR